MKNLMPSFFLTSSLTGFHPNKIAMLLGILLVPLLMTWGEMSRGDGLQPGPLSFAAELDIKKAPIQKDWQRFLRLPRTFHRELWQDYLRAGTHLKDWSWQWRLGWLRACSGERVGELSESCAGILNEALDDPALVVRAKAAEQIGNLYEGTSDLKRVRQLSQAFVRDGNRRNGKAMFVQYRILYALNLIGGDDAQSVGVRLAGQSEDTAMYWQKLVRAQATDTKKGI